MAREVVLDTETTGLSRENDRIIEIGAIEVIDGIETGRTYHQRIQPNRPIPEEASKIHGIRDEDLVGCPVFGQVVDGFLEFIGDSELVIHNGLGFDLHMINAELKRIDRPELANRIIDTMQVAMRKFGRGARVSLDALADRFGIDRSFREVHGALIDCILLARVHAAMIGRNDLLQASAVVEATPIAAVVVDTPFMPESARQRWFALRGGIEPSEAELAAHAAFVGKLSEAVWNTYLTETVV